MRVLGGHGVSSLDLEKYISKDDENRNMNCSAYSEYAGIILRGRSDK